MGCSAPHDGDRPPTTVRRSSVVRHAVLSPGIGATARARVAIGSGGLGRLGGLAELLLEHLDGAADPQQRLAQRALLLLELGQHLLARLVLRLELFEAELLQRPQETPSKDFHHFLVRSCICLAMSSTLASASFRKASSSRISSSMVGESRAGTCGSF